MRPIFFFLFGISFLYAENQTAEPGKNPFLNPSMLKNFPSTSNTSKAEGNKEPDMNMGEKAKSYISIDAKKRAEDYLKAYELLRKDKPSSRIFFKLTNGSSISNIADVQIVENGTLILFKTTTTQGFKYEIVPVEEISSLGHL